MRAATRRLPALAVSLLLTALAPSASSSPASSSSLAASVPSGDLQIELGRGPVTIRVPDTYSSGQAAPLVILLHGFGSNSRRAENIFQLDPLSNDYGFIYVTPNGALDRSGQRNWNGTDACCDFQRIRRDDSGYLRTIIDVTESLLNVDPHRIYIVGVSNGGFMAYRMACDHSDKIAAIVSLAGATYYLPEDCAPMQPVHTLQIHGTMDTTVLYDGGFLAAPYPGAVESALQWASFGGCEAVARPQRFPLDLDLNVPGAETLVTRYASACQPGGSAELWSIAGGSHTPLTSRTFGRHIIEYLYAHPKP